ncbi:hypothetical protein GEMRC1_011618 [Eukaryota sp. GEM-RC1]
MLQTPVKLDYFKNSNFVDIVDVTTRVAKMIVYKPRCHRLCLYSLLDGTYSFDMEIKLPSRLKGVSGVKLSKSGLYFAIFSPLFCSIWDLSQDNEPQELSLIPEISDGVLFFEFGAQFDFYLL